MNTLNDLVGRFNTWLESYCPPFPEELPDKPPDTLFGFVAYFTRPFWPLLLASATFSIVISLIEVYLFSFVGNLVDWLATSQRENFWDTYRTRLIAIGILVLVLLPALKFVYEGIVHQGLLGNFAMRTRWQAHRYLLRQSVDFFQSDFAGRVATKMMQTSLGIRDAVIKITEVLLYVAVYFTGAMVLFATSDLRLTAPMLLWLTGYIFTLRYFIPRMRRISMEQAEARSMVTGRVVDSYTNITTVKMFSHSNAEDEYAREGMTEFLDTVYQQMRLSALLTVVLNWLNAGLLFLVGATSILLWHQDAVTVGAIAFAMGLVMRMQGMSQWILWEIAGLFENIGIIQDGIDVISRDIAITDRKDATSLHMNGGQVRFRNVYFNYGKDLDPGTGGVIADFSLEISPGEKIGLVGRSGAGKSTLVNLLLRFYDAESGAIEIDGQDIAGVTQDSLRAQIGMVTQDTSLLHRSVIDNIRYGSPDADMDVVVAAAKQARAHDFILGLEDPDGRKGYEAHVGERGIKLSGGQRQRIAIARVLLKNAPILVLDEATSALDSEVEAAIQESLYTLMVGKTVVAIAHRLSTIAQMDRLVVMDRGSIMETGTHQELLTWGGLYADLWSRQSGGFLAGNTIPPKGGQIAGPGITSEGSRPVPGAFRA
ncbi:MAG: ABC transporter ATP-binding protein [Gammaproteobacteria bacterium]|nr:ABC transporter ATP-binding protein [Gammaproteobacteria bacterium]MYG65692.1 ABC transporter ATP-binding protein [Gammaproteobacteria bacterium]